ncbi:MAG: imidazole glycerol phosphate synthase subunit HisH [Sediminibacterium sp.]|jgi:glutamine amidotransferase|nr:imidazole glycerol phosphate synthase subunit HisH [Sediminibacterium sp.]
MNVAIVKYNAGNILSVTYALERLGISPVVTDNIEELQKADRVIFPGVGEASTAMAYLKERSLDAVIKNLEQPVLGICLGMQLLCSYSEENNTNCLSVFDERVVSFLANGADKIPQVGWNTISDFSSELFKGLPANAYCYFVHGYYAALGPDTIATTNYILPYSAALHKNNFYGVQFHPEKSAAVGEKILQNFLDII